MRKKGGHGWGMVLDAIEDDLHSGKLQPGDHLPPDRELAATLGVRESEVQEALRVLEVLGLVRGPSGADTGAGAVIVASPSGGMGSLMRLQLAAQGIQIDQHNLVYPIPQSQIDIFPGLYQQNPGY